MEIDPAPSIARTTSDQNNSRCCFDNFWELIVVLTRGGTKGQEFDLEPLSQALSTPGTKHPLRSGAESPRRGC